MRGIPGGARQAGARSREGVRRPKGVTSCAHAHSGARWSRDEDALKLMLPLLPEFDRYVRGLTVGWALPSGSRCFRAAASYSDDWGCQLGPQSEQGGHCERARQRQARTGGRIARSSGGAASAPDVARLSNPRVELGVGRTGWRGPAPACRRRYVIVGYQRFRRRRTAPMGLRRNHLDDRGVGICPRFLYWRRPRSAR